MSEPELTPNAPARRLLRGYGPLVGFAIAFLAVVLMVPTVPETTVSTTATGAQIPDPLVAGANRSRTGSESGDTDAAADGSTDGSADGAPDGTGAGTDAADVAAGGAGRNAAPGQTGPPKLAACSGNQVPGDPYSPPCYLFTGSNGGSTTRGVTDTEIVVSVRLGSFDNGALDALSRVAGAKIPSESRDKIQRTVEGITEFVNRVYQLYGRKIRIEFFDGRGQPEREILGGGQEAAEADALQVAEEFGAFADISAISPPYADALSRRAVVNVGVPHTSREWMTQRRPFAWSQFADCSLAVETVSSYYLSKLAGRPAAFAGGSLADTPRRLAIIAPDNSWYQECATSGVARIQAGGAGGELILNEAYRLDINQMAPQATSLVAKLKSNGITTVVCGCDPLILSFLTSKSREQSYDPEWVATGLALTDQDLIGQILDQQAYDGAFGVSFAGQSLPLRATPGYAAFKAVRSGEEPSQAVDLIYNQLRILAIGIHMAGPNLTPQTFEQGMFAYPARSGAYGTWEFGPSDYTTSQDVREVYWDSQATSPATNTKGAWIDPSGGRSRYRDGQFPASDPIVG